MNIILFDQLPESAGNGYRISSKDPRGQHILKILKLQTGDTFEMGIVNGYSGTARIESIQTAQTVQAVQAVQAAEEHSVGSDAGNDAADGGAGKTRYITFSWKPQRPPKPLYPVTLLVGYVRPICMKRILREAVSLGVGEIWIAGTDLGEKSYREAKLWSGGGYRSYLLDGAQQAGETSVPVLRQFRDISAAFHAADDERSGAMKLILDPIPGASGFFETVQELVKARSWNESAQQYSMLAVGSERGWSDRERKLYTQHGWVRTGLGCRILRTETACSAGIGVLLAALGFLEDSDIL